MVEVNGWVNFPIHSPEWIDSQEGGMVVKLVVFEDENVNPKDTFCKCTGGHVYDMLGEVFVADDKLPLPEYDENVGYKSFKQEWEDYCRFHYPMYNKFGHSIWEQNLSRPYLAAMIIGSTNWSGHDKDGNYWFCTFNDLTEKGKNLYRIMQKIYNADVRLLTILDT